MSKSLPSYKNPPVNEVVCGMRFVTPDNLRITHFGLLWDKFKSGYPEIQHASPIASSKGEITIDTSGNILPRVWFINKTDDQLVQFQVDRFYFNWRRREAEYPRYENVIKNFENTFNIIKEYFSEFDLGELQPVEYELSYINHIPRGEGWESIDDIPKLFSDFVWSEKKDRFLPQPSKIFWKADFKISENGGILNVNLKEAITVKDKTPLLIFELKAIGEAISSNKEDAIKWFNIAHKWIVEGFTDLITPHAYELWKRE